MNFSIILPANIKGKSIRSILNYIEAIQSYRGSWPTLIVDLESIEKLETMTPIPANMGGVTFIEFYIDEESLIKHLETIGVRSLEENIALSALINEEEFWDIWQRDHHIIAESVFEVLVPLRDYPRDSGIEIIETDIVIVSPRKVRQVLDDAETVYEFLKKLEKLFNENGEYMKKVPVMKLIGYVTAEKNLYDLEKNISEKIKETRIKIIEGTFMYNRLIAPS